jgi:hypothetical protein
VTGRSVIAAAVLGSGKALFVSWSSIRDQVLTLDGPQPDE